MKGHISVNGQRSLSDEDFVKCYKPSRVANFQPFGKSVEEGGISGLAAVKDCFFILPV